MRTKDEILEEYRSTAAIRRFHMWMEYRALRSDFDGIEEMEKSVQEQDVTARASENRPASELNRPMSQRLFPFKGNVRVPALIPLRPGGVHVK